MTKKIKEIDSICKKYDIKNYIINSDGSIDVKSDVDLFRQNLHVLPLKFNIVYGNFYCYINGLKTLKGCPVYVKNNFICVYNLLTSLKYSPKEIGGDFMCYNNKLRSLEHGPEKVGSSYYCDNNKLVTLKGSVKYIYGGFYCDDNELKTLKYCPEHIYGDFLCNNNKLKSLEYGPKYVGGDYCCKSNKLKTLKGCAKYIKKKLKIDGNLDIYSFEDIPYNISDLQCENTILYNVWKLFKDVSEIELFNDMDIIRETRNGKPAIIIERLNGFLDMIGKSTVEKVEGYINI